MNQPPPVVVFDFDLTLTRWDTADRFFRWLLRRSPPRLALLAIALPVLAPMLAFKRTRRWPIHAAVWIATLGRSVADLERLAHTHVEAVYAGGEPVFVDAGLARLREHLAQGHAVVIATGCMELLARVFLRRAGFGEVALVASTLRPWYGGLANDRHCFGANKVPMLAERGFAPPWDIGYTDHHCDLPVLRHCRQWYLVSPRAECLARIQQALAAEAAILAWR